MDFQTDTLRHLKSPNYLFAFYKTIYGQSKYIILQCVLKQKINHVICTKVICLALPCLCRTSPQTRQRFPSQYLLQFSLSLQLSTNLRSYPSLNLQYLTHLSSLFFLQSSCHYNNLHNIMGKNYKFITSSTPLTIRTAWMIMTLQNHVVISCMIFYLLF